MKKIIGALGMVFLVSACHSTRPATSAPAPASTAPAAAGATTGAVTSQAAVLGFLAAVKNQDLQALSNYWGDKQGLARDRYEMTALNRREIIMICYLRHDSAQILSDAPSPDGGRTVAVQLTRGALTASTNFQTVIGPDGRWYVQAADITPLQRFCAH